MKLQHSNKFTNNIDIIFNKLQKNPDVIDFIPAKFLADSKLLEKIRAADFLNSKKILIRYIKENWSLQNGDSLFSIAPKELQKDKAVIIAALEQKNVNILEFIPKDFFTNKTILKELFVKHIQILGRIIKQQVISKDDYRDEIENHPDTIMFLLEQEVEISLIPIPDIFWKSSKFHLHVIKKFPQRKDIALAVIKQDSNFDKKLSPEFQQNVDIIFEALKANPDRIDEVPKESVEQVRSIYHPLERKLIEVNFFNSKKIVMRFLNAGFGWVRPPWYFPCGPNYFLAFSDQLKQDNEVVIALLSQGNRYVLASVNQVAKQIWKNQEIVNALCVQSIEAIAIALNNEYISWSDISDKFKTNKDFVVKILMLIDIVHLAIPSELWIIPGVLDDLCNFDYWKSDLTFDPKINPYERERLHLQKIAEALTGNDISWDMISDQFKNQSSFVISVSFELNRIARWLKEPLLNDPYQQQFYDRAISIMNQLLRMPGILDACYIGTLETFSYRADEINKETIERCIAARKSEKLAVKNLTTQGLFLESSSDQNAPINCAPTSCLLL